MVRKAKSPRNCGLFASDILVALVSQKATANLVGIITVEDWKHLINAMTDTLMIAMYQAETSVAKCPDINSCIGQSVRAMTENKSVPFFVWLLAARLRALFRSSHPYTSCLINHPIAHVPRYNKFVACPRAASVEP